MKLTSNQKVGGAVAAFGALTTAGLTVMAHRANVSRRGWLAANLVIPALFRKRGGQLARLYDLIEKDRTSGPPLPSRKLQSQYCFRDRMIGNTRVLALRRKDVTSPGTRILYLHGGAYVFKLMALHWSIVAGLARRTGAEVVVPIYPLAPEYQMEAGLAAVEAVYRSLVEDVGAPNVFIVGDSAGGGLALALAHRLQRAGAPAPGALILYFPWLDATVSGSDQPELEKSDPMLSIEQLREAGRLWSGNEPGDSRASPLFENHAGLPPVMIMVGTKDLLVSDARRFALLHPAADLREFPGMFHGFVATPIPEARRALDDTATFIASVQRGAG